MDKKKVFILILIILAILGAVVFFNLRSKMQYNDDNAIGNTAGNLNNGGFFCESNGVIYFSNPYDDSKLYSMNSDCTNAKKLSDDHVASINVHGNYIYYVKNNTSSNSVNAVLHGQLTGVFRCNLDGKNVVSLYDKPSGIISLCGNYVYYQHYDNTTALTLYKIKIDKTDNKLISKSNYNPSSFYNGKIYFSNITDNHNICSIDTKTDSVSTFFSGNTYLTDMEGAYLYYIDIDKGYSLVRLNTQNNTIELLSSGRCINYNLYGNKIFYQKEGEDAGLYRMNIDGTNQEHIALGDFNNIHCTSQYTFFQYLNNPGVLYRVPTTGTINLIEQITIK